MAWYTMSHYASAATACATAGSQQRAVRTRLTIIRSEAAGDFLT